MKSDIFEINDKYTPTFDELMRDIETALYKGGYNILDGYDNAIIIRHENSDTDYIIKVEEIIEDEKVEMKWSDRMEQYFSGKPVENPISYQEFLDAYETEMLCLSCYGKDGLEIDETMEEISPYTKVLEFSRCGNSFDVVLDM